MKKTRFTDNQIINILKQAEQGVLSPSYVASTTLAKAPFIIGAQSMVVWMPL